MQFNEKSRKFALEVMTQLEAGPLSPAEFVARTGASRAKVMRMLSYLLEKGMVIKSQTGPKALYTKPQPLDFATISRHIEEGTPRMLCVALSVQDANAIVAALDTVSRIGIGQWTVLADAFRWGTLLSSNALDLDELDKSLTVLKYQALGFSGGSWGIFSPNVHSSAADLYRMKKALHHRLAWDRNPEGGMGVHFDDPMPSEVLSGFTVSSLVDQGEVSLCITATLEQLRSLKVGLDKYVALAQGSFGLLLDGTSSGLGPRPREHHRPNSGAVFECLQHVHLQATGSVAGGGLPLSPATQRLAQLSEHLEAHLLQPFSDTDEVRRLELPRIGELPAAEGIFCSLKGFPTGVLRICDAAAVGKLGRLNQVISEIPRGYGISRERDAYQVLRVDEAADCIVVIGSSFSIQTALCMVHNAATGRSLRSYSF
jgi:hypothetical protein